MSEKVFSRIIELADSAVKRFKPDKMKWMWGEALFNYALSELDKFLGEDRYLEFYKAYIDNHIKKGILIDQSDTSAPGLVSYVLYKGTQDDKYLEVLNKVINYLKTTPKIIDDLPNHLGVSKIGKLYPKSIWVDSIMMYGVFGSLVASATNDKELFDFAFKQPLIFAKYLQDKQSKLFHHSYWVKNKKAYPDKIFWARGNGWMVTALPKVIDLYPYEDDVKTEMIKLFSELCESILLYQREDGYFNTLLNLPSYKESSATALIACGFLHGVRCGYLSNKFKTAGFKAINSLINDLEIKKGLLSMPYISGPTIPLQIFPKLGYKLIPRKNDWPYGLAALILAGIEYKKLEEEYHE